MASRAKDEENIFLPKTHNELDILKRGYRLGYNLCPDAQYIRMGALIVTPHVNGFQIIGAGQDTLKLGVKPDSKFYEPLMRLDFITDAPLVAARVAKNNGMDLKGTTVYTPAMPTTRCLEQLLAQDIRTIVVHHDFNAYVSDIDPDWKIRYTQSLRFIQENRMRFKGLIGNLSTHRDKVVTVFRGKEYEV